MTGTMMNWSNLKALSRIWVPHPDITEETRALTSIKKNDAVNSRRGRQTGIYRIRNSGRRKR